MEQIEANIAVLLTVHDRKNKTLRCLENLYKQVLPNYLRLDIYLTDDGCTDGTPEAIKRQFPKVHIIKGDGNLFWNRGMYRHRRQGLAPRCRLIASWGWSRSQGYGCSPFKAVRELGSERRETVRSLSSVGAGDLMEAAPSTRGPGWTHLR